MIELEKWWEQNRLIHVLGVANITLRNGDNGTVSMCNFHLSLKIHLWKDLEMHITVVMDARLSKDEVAVLIDQWDHVTGVNEQVTTKLLVVAIDSKGPTKKKPKNSGNRGQQQHKKRNVKAKMSNNWKLLLQENFLFVTVGITI
jgi:hypothetical protein